MLTDDQVRARLAALDRFIKEGSNFQTWDMIVPFMDQNGQFKGIHGEWNDWPPQVRDPIFEAMVRDCIPRPRHGIRVVASGCFQDVPDEPCYLRVVVQEFPEQVN